MVGQYSGSYSPVTSLMSFMTIGLTGKRQRGVATPSLEGRLKLKRVGRWCRQDMASLLEDVV